MATFLVSAAKHGLSASHAVEKVEALMNLLNRYYTGWAPYDGHSSINNVQTAIAYVVSKKTTKAKRKAGQSAAAMTFGMAGAIIGGAAGTVALPGAGSALGAVTVGTIVGAVPTVGVQLFRKTKFLYKTLRGTQGVHRKEAATALYNAAKPGDPKSKDTYAAAGAILVILNGDEAEMDSIMGGSSKDAIEAIAKRLKSW